MPKEKQGAHGPFPGTQLTVGGVQAKPGAPGADSHLGCLPSSLSELLGSDKHLIRRSLTYFLLFVPYSVLLYSVCIAFVFSKAGFQYF